VCCVVVKVVKQATQTRFSIHISNFNIRIGTVSDMTHCHTFFDQFFILAVNGQAKKETRSKIWLLRAARRLAFFSFCRKKRLVASLFFVSPIE
jgi:hypothetical protein